MTDAIAMHAARILHPSIENLLADPIAC